LSQHWPSFFWVVGRLRLVLIPLAIALLLAAFLAPGVRWLRQWGRLPPSVRDGG
jgi:predicted PurR-regulated permease PerM